MASSSLSWSYDVFLSFRGEDTRKTFVDHLYSALVERIIRTYKDDQTLPRGDSIGPSLLEAIEGSQIALIIFSENYANSSWCLDELVCIMKCRDERGQTVIPIFYNVDPSEVRKQKGKFGEAFIKLHKENMINKVESWRKALFDASNIAGWEPKYIANGHESVGIKKIVDAILDKLLSLNSDIDEDLVGMGSRLQSLKSLLEIGSGGVHMVGIWGIGGSGKTTLAYSAYLENSHHFESHCIIDNIREELATLGLKNLQEKLLSTLLKTKVGVQSVEEGKSKIRRRLGHSNVLIVLDDVDEDSQLEALAGSHKWFGNGSRIIITTRDEHLLRKNKVNKISPASLLSHDEAIQLFDKHAYQEDNPIEDYDILSQLVISYADGLPLALKVLGSFLCDKDKNEWISAIAKLKDIPNLKIIDKLKISYDGLELTEKELFLDIACFFRRARVNQATEILHACGFHPGIGIKVLRQKALITISNGKFDMHDLVQEMGHYIVRGQNPYNPENHSRVWHDDEIEGMCSTDATTENDKIEAIHFSGCSSGFPKLVSNMKKLRLLNCVMADDLSDQDVEGPSFLSNELRYIHYADYPRSPLPESFQPRKLLVLKLPNTLQKELWKGYKHLPHLKELKLEHAENLLSTPNFDGLPCLEKLSLFRCNSLEDIDPSLGYHNNLVYVYISGCQKLRTFPTIVRMKKLKILEIEECEALLEFPEIQANMDSLIELTLSEVGIEVLPSSIGRYCTNLILLKVEDCEDLKSIEGSFQTLKRLQKFEFRCLYGLDKLPNDLFSVECCLEELTFADKFKPFTRGHFLEYFPRFLRKLNLPYCGLEDGEIPSGVGELFNLTELDLCGNRFSRLHFSLLKLTRLKVLNLSNCDKLLELPELPSSIVALRVNGCHSLESIGDFYTKCKRLCQVSLFDCENVTGAERLLQSMLHGKAIENHCMSLQVDGLEIPKMFITPLCEGRSCRLQLPENWCNDFCGFLMCAVSAWDSMSSPQISMKHEQGNTMREDPESVFWKECDNDQYTWVGYVSFGSLRHTKWWDPTYNAVMFSISGNAGYGDTYRICSGFGARLVSRKYESDLTETSTDSSDFCDENDDYMFKFKIKHDSKSALDIY